MRIPLTDEFLWSLYQILEQTGDILKASGMFRLRTWQEVTSFPEFQRIRGKIEKERRKRQFSQFINYLKREGYIKIKNFEDKKGILLTPKGKQKALKIKYKRSPKFKRRKDKKWIMVIFDIPEKMRRHRDDLRGFLYSLDFKHFQKSVWISPYNVLEELKEIIRVLGLDQFVKIFLIEETEI